MKKELDDRAIYWVDKFSVPTTAMPSFVDKMSEIYDYIKGLSGCRNSEILSEISGNEHFNVVAIVEWENLPAMEAAREALANWRGECGFNPSRFETALGVESDFIQYSAMAS